MNRLLGAFLILAAAVVGIFFMAYPFVGEDGHEVWAILNWGMAVAVLLSVYFAYTWLRGLGDDASTKEFITHKILFLGAALLVLWYFPAWFTELVYYSHGASDLERALSEGFWLLVDPLFVLVVGCVGLRLSGKA